MSRTDIPDAVYDILIVGGGPGGYTAGLYAARADLRTLLIEGASTVSQISTTEAVENYPGIPEAIGGFDLVDRFRRQALQFGLNTESADVTAIERTSGGKIPLWKVTTSGGIHEALAVIVATGAHWRALDVPGEAAFAGRGVSNCATCDAPFYRNREVVVVGGGDTAIQEALFLTHFASKVTVVHRRNRLRATAILQKRALDNPRIVMAWKSVVEEIKGNGGVEAVTVRDVYTGERRDIPAHGVFIFVGLIPNADLLRGLADLTDGGAIVVDRQMRTSAPGLFACGDCTDKLLRQVVTACGDGATAAYAAQLYVEELKGEAY